MYWTFHAHDGAPDDAVSRWRLLNETVASDNPALRHEFVAHLTKYFGGDNVKLGLCWEGEELIAGGLFRPTGMGTWTSFVPGQACVCPFLLLRPTDLDKVMSSLLSSLPGFCWLIRLQKVDPALHPVPGFEELRRAELAVYGTTYSIDLESTFDEYWTGRSKRVRRTIRKTLESVDKAGFKLRLQSASDSRSVVDGVTIHGDLESSGWKGSEGTAIARDNVQGAFYRSLLAEFAETSGAITAQLYLNDDAIASLLCVANAGTVIVLKTTYSEKHSSLSPGRLIDYFFLKECFDQEQLKVAETYMTASRTDLCWATDQRQWYNINVYRWASLKKALGALRPAKQFIKSLLDRLHS